ncbi:FkbM family methyltransferase [Aminobacter sp. BA135]|uniref:FkbM family methyltransferase n=1 Tax=Aminobacter sp. BA135 TaxID=537596 RepID=UPI003D7AA1FE
MKCCVYTVLVGGYEHLNEQPVASCSQLPFICLTDDPALRSESWDCRVVEPLFPQDPIRSQRNMKIRPHVHLPDYDCSIYIDNSVILKQPPERMLELFDPAIGFLVAPHSCRETVLDEFLEVARQGFDDASRIFEQLNHYTLSCPEILEERPWWTGMMIRDHRSARVTSMLEAWAFHVMRYSRRDQLSMNVAFRSASFSPTAWAVDNRESNLHLWPHIVGRNRDLGSRNPAISLMPAAARVRRMELKEAAWTAQEHAYRAEIARLNAKAEARKPHNRLRRLGEKLLRLPDRRTGSRTPEEAVALPVRVRAPGGAWIHVHPLDRRGQKLIQSDGNLNPPALSAWHLLLQQHAWTHVIDVGANYGEMLVNGGLPSGASIIAVEPNPAIRPYLERTLREAGLPAIILDAALSDKEGQAALHVDPNWSGTARLAKPGDNGALPVRTTTLERVLRSFDACPSMMRVLVKLDVEGDEANILRGALAILPSLGEFAALVEIQHVAPADLVWLVEHFEISLLDMQPGGGLVTTPPRQLGDMLRSGRYHTQDAVLRRRS